MKFTADNYVTIQGWMVTDLGLKGNALLVYAAIYGFSQKEDQWFTGGQQYLAELCKSSVRGIWKNLNDLRNMGLIEVSFSDRDARWNKYRTTEVRLLPEQSSTNSLQEQSSGNYEQSSGIENEIPELSDEIPELSDKNAGTEFRQNININNNINNIPPKKEEGEVTRACAREAAASPIPELTEEQIREIVSVWNDQKLTKSIVGIHHMSKREDRTRICISRCGFDDFILTISKIDHQAFFRKLSEEEGRQIQFDWFVNPETFLKALEGNYEEAWKPSKKGKAKTTRDWSKL